MTWLEPAGEPGRMLGAARALRLSPSERRWWWWPDRGELVALGPVGSRRPSPEQVAGEARELEPTTILLGPVDRAAGPLGLELATRLVDAGHWVAAVWEAPPRGAAVERRFDLADGFLATETKGATLCPAIPGRQNLASRPATYRVPLTGTARALAVRWVELTGGADSEAVFAAAFHEAAECPVPFRPLPWPRGVPSLGVWAGGRLRALGWSLLDEDEPRAAELFAAARRVEGMVPTLDRVATAGLLGQVPGLGAAAREALEGILAEPA